MLAMPLHGARTQEPHDRAWRQRSCLLAFLDNDARVPNLAHAARVRVRCAFDLMTETGARLTMSRRIYS